jgi:hypothetical protein
MEKENVLSYLLKMYKLNNNRILTIEIDPPTNINNWSVFNFTIEIF